MAPLVWSARQVLPARLSVQETIGSGLMARERNVNSMLHMQKPGRISRTYRKIRELSQQLTEASDPAYIEPGIEKNGMTTRRTWLAAIWLLPLLLSGGLHVEPAPVAAQAPSVIKMDEEPHHHLALKNDVVKVFEIDFAPRDAISMHRHDNDEVSIAVGDATTVSTTPGQADVLRIS